MTTSRVANRAGFEGISHEVQNGNLVLAFRGLVDVGNVGGVVLVVVELHGRSINVRFQGIVSVRKIIELVSIRDGGSSKGGSGHEGLGNDFATSAGSGI